MAAKGMKALQIWCKRTIEDSGYENVSIDNMTTSWRDGLAFCALIHRYRPDLIDFNSLSKENVLYNNQLAFSVAEKELGIAALLDPEDMVAMRVPDKLSIMTYVSQYYNRLHTMKPADDEKPLKRKSTPTSTPEMVKIKKKDPEPVVNKENKETNVPRIQTSYPNPSFTCEICKKKVHLVERFIDEGKVYHRQCHRRDKSMISELKKYKNAEKEGETTNPNPTNRNENRSTEAPVKRSASRVADMISVFSNGQKQKKVVNTENAKEEKMFEKPESSKPEVLESKNENKDLKDSNPSKEYKPRKVPDTTDSVPSEREFPAGQGERVMDKTQNERPLPVARVENIVQNIVVADTELGHKTGKLPLKDNSGDNKTKSYTKVVSPNRDLSPSSAIAPLISELPASPVKRPTPRNTSSETKPKPRQRSFNKHNPGPGTNHRDYAQVLNPFDESDEEEADHAVAQEKVSDKTKDQSENKPKVTSDNTAKQETKAEKTKDNSGYNPFEDTEDDLSDNEDVEDIKNTTTNKESTNPFENLEDENPFHEEEGRNPFEIDDDSSDEAYDESLNPFGDADGAQSDEIQENGVTNGDLGRTPQQQKNVTKTNSAPKPPNRRKGPAPPPPKAPSSEGNFPKSPSPKPPRAEVNMLNVPSSREKPPRSPTSGTKPARPAPGYGFPLIKRDVKREMNEDEIMSEMTILDVQLKDLEKKGVKLEEVLRGEVKTETDQLLPEWFELVHEKNKLVRRETDLVYLMQQQRLEQEHADIEFKIRKLLNKPEAEKTSEDKEEESRLLDQLVEVVERRNVIINSIEEARVKEEEEDAAYDLMKHQMESPVHSDNTKKKKKKNKVKKMFSKKKKPPKHDS
uniref:Calponin-homology (CH) domain-containing protein n=1 Tax=Ciona savignyi TaxID=51511 RepID=H2YHI1_CIOSA